MLIRNTLWESITSLYVAIAKFGFESFRCFSIEHIEGSFRNAREFYKVAWPRELFWMRTLHTFFPKGYNLDGKSSLRKSKKTSHKTPMLWKRHPKHPSLSIPSLTIPRVSSLEQVNPLGIVVVNSSIPRVDDASTSNCRVFAYRDYKRRLVFLDRLMSSGKFSYKVFDMYNVKILFKLLYTLELPNWGYC